MKALSFILLSIFAPLASAEHHAETAKELATVPVKDFTAAKLTANGFTPLITDKGLEDFIQHGGQEAVFAIKDGVLTGSAAEMKLNSFLCTKKSYSDFILAFEFKFDHLEGNSGCMFRGLTRDAERKGVTYTQLYGYQCEHDNSDRSWTAGLYDEKRRHWIFPVKKDKAHAQAMTEQGQRIFKKNDWNSITIKCIGNHIQTWLNGEARVDFTDTDPEHSNREGIFGFQIHNGKKCDVRWRNIYIKELTTTQ